jgi:hypothetical protein
MLAYPKLSGDRMSAKPFVTRDRLLLGVRGAAPEDGVRS